MISCFRGGPEQKKQCMRGSFVGSLLSRSAEFFSSSILCRKGNLKLKLGLSSKSFISCIPLLPNGSSSSKTSGGGGGSSSIQTKKSHFRRVSEVDFSKTYKIGKTLGHGGFSIVKTGVHLLTGEPVAIKIIDRSKYGPKDESLEREIQVLEKVQHPNCICFKECFFTTNSVYLITELVTGGELLDRVLARGKYTENDAAKTIQQVLLGVAYLHSVGIVHRDLKLENILLKTPEDDSIVKIADFGLSKIFSGAAILSTICGSPQYVAPEVLEVGQKRSSYSPAADLWSVGVILYILLSGFSPFDDVSESALFKKIKKGHYSFQAPVWESISDDAKDLVCGLLCVSPDKRMTAAAALAHPWIQQHVHANGENWRGGQHGSSPETATSALKLHVSAAPSHLPTYPETSESSDDEDSEDLLSSNSRSSQLSSSNSTKAESISPTQSASNLQRGDDPEAAVQSTTASGSGPSSTTAHRPQTPEHHVRNAKGSEERRNSWRDVTAFKKHKAKKGYGKGKNTRFTDMNF